jgi:toxin FitB
MELQFAEQILPVDAQACKLWAEICSRIGNKSIDNLIAATAIRHNLTVVTRNTKHFEPTGARCFNPFE